MRKLIFSSLIFSVWFLLLAGIAPAATNGNDTYAGRCDVNGDTKIGLAEAVNALRVVAGLAGSPSTSEQLEAQYVANTLVLATAQSMSASEEMNEVFAAMGLTKTELTSTSALNLAIEMVTMLSAANCGQASRNVNTVTYTFNDSRPCHIGGAVSISPSYSAPTISLAMTFNNVTVPLNDSTTCTINGTTVVTTSYSSDNNQITLTYSMTAMTICGSPVSGTITAIFDVTTGLLVALTVQADITVDLNGTPTVVSMNVTYNPATGVISGTATFTTGGTTYNCTFSNIVIDPNCGLPKSGTMTVNGILFDFSNTTCANPTVEVTIHGFTLNMSLQEALNLLM